ncbi:MAG: hypothetical protein ABUL60_21585, partial [Myxococcales bacterium]
MPRRGNWVARWAAVLAMDAAAAMAGALTPGAPSGCWVVAGERRAGSSSAAAPRAHLAAGGKVTLLALAAPPA